MSDNEAFERVENAIKSLEKTKSFFRMLIAIFAGATIVLIGDIATSHYKINKLDREIDLAASKKGVELLRQSYQAEQKAFINLLDHDYQEAARQFHDDCKKINDNIFIYSMSVTRGGQHLD